MDVPTIDYQEFQSRMEHEFQWDPVIQEIFKDPDGSHACPFCAETKVTAS